jgi:hypothetical protein
MRYEPNRPTGQSSAAQPVEGELLMPGESPAREAEAGGSNAVVAGWLKTLSVLLDDAFAVPGLPFRVGFDPLIGLIPVFGDLATVSLSFYILITAAKMQLPKATLYRMGLNIAIDYIVGSIPFLGNVFDFFWKANAKNMELLERALAAPPAERRKQSIGDSLFVAGLFAFLITLLIGSLTVAILIARWIAGLFSAA